MTKCTVKCLQVPRGLEAGLVDIVRRHFSLVQYAVNKNPPHDVVIEFSKAAEGQSIISFVKKVTHIKGQSVKLNAELVSCNDN